MSGNKSLKDLINILGRYEQSLVEAGILSSVLVGVNTTKLVSNYLKDSHFCEIRETINREKDILKLIEKRDRSVFNQIDIIPKKRFLEMINENKAILHAAKICNVDLTSEGIDRIIQRFSDILSKHIKSGHMSQIWRLIDSIVKE